VCAPPALRTARQLRTLHVMRVLSRLIQAPIATYEVECEQDVLLSSCTPWVARARPLCTTIVLVAYRKQGHFFATRPVILPASGLSSHAGRCFDSCVSSDGGAPFPRLRQRRRLHPHELSSCEACTMRVSQTCARRLPLGSCTIWKVATGYDLENLTTSSSGRGRPSACFLVQRVMCSGYAAFQLIKSSSPKRRFIQVFKEKSFGFCTGLVIVRTNLFELTCEPKS
jgi:hypothetical protein